MDFDWFFYISTTILNLTEEEFWKSTPRKIGALWRIHAKFNGWKFKEENEQEERLYIDQVPFL